MRTSIITRSVVATASLAIASVALAAAPADVTRDMVLAAASGLRAADAADESLSSATQKALRSIALRSIALRSCGVDADNGDILPYVDGLPTQPNADADGVIVYAPIYNTVDNSATRYCLVGAVAPTAAGFTLTGSGSLNVVTVADSATLERGSVGIAAGPTSLALPMSGDVAATAFTVPANEGLGEVSLAASGASVKVTKTTTTVKDKKTKAEKKAYTKKKASAKAAYKYAIADFKIVKKASSQTDSRPFSIATPVL